MFLRSREPDLWAYCANHLFGQWVEGDRVMVWRLRRQGDAK